MGIVEQLRERLSRELSRLPSQFRLMLLSIGLRAIAEFPGVRRRLVVHMGDRSLATGDGIEMLGVSAFIGEVERGTIFP